MNYIYIIYPQNRRLYLNPCLNILISNIISRGYGFTVLRWIRPFTHQRHHFSAVFTTAPEHHARFVLCSHKKYWRSRQINSFSITTKYHGASEQGFVPCVRQQHERSRQTIEVSRQTIEGSRQTIE